MPAVSPAGVGRNEYYKSEEEYLAAVAEALREEYLAIVDAGFMVQIDDPRLVSYYMVNPKLSIKEVRKWAERRVELLNHALRGIPREKIRYHTCYGINMGPRVHEMEFKDHVEVVLKINAGGYSFEAANPRHEHEWQVWKDVKLPKGAVLIPGVISHVSNVVEHPELICERIVRLAKLVGRENVIASTDCGFAQGPFYRRVHPQIMWAKLQAMVDGAKLATKELWGGKKKAKETKAKKPAAKKAAPKKSAAKKKRAA